MLPLMLLLPLPCDVCVFAWVVVVVCVWGGGVEGCVEGVCCQQSAVNTQMQCMVQWGDKATSQVLLLQLTSSGCLESWKLFNADTCRVHPRTACCCCCCHWACTVIA
jgi:hypothetical protein